MKLEVICPACKKEFRFTDRSGLGTVACPHCGDDVPTDLGTIVAEEAGNNPRTIAREQSQRCPNCGKPISINGLWGLAFGNGRLAGARGTLFFTAGPHFWRGATETNVHGVVGSISVTH